MYLKYLLGAIISIPLLPFLYIQAKFIRARVPVLPEAEDPAGTTGMTQEDTLRIICIGESTVAGVGIKKHEQGLGGTFARALGTETGRPVSWKVYAKSGYSAKQAKDHLLPAIQEDHLDLILIGLGGNDAFTLNTPWNWIKHIEGIVSELRSRYPDTPIAFLNMPPIKIFPAFTPLLKFVIGNLVEIHGDALEAYVQGKKNLYYYAHRITARDYKERLGIQMTTEELFSDGVHPAQITYQLWATDMLRYLQEETPVIERLMPEASRMMPS